METLEEINTKRKANGRIRTQQYRMRIYEDKGKHAKVLEKDRKRWHTYYNENKATEDPETRKEKARIKKQKQREKARAINKEKDKQKSIPITKEQEMENQIRNSKRKTKSTQRELSRTRQELISIKGLVQQSIMKKHKNKATNGGGDRSGEENSVMIVDDQHEQGFVDNEAIEFETSTSSLNTSLSTSFDASLNSSMDTSMNTSPKKSVGQAIWDVTTPRTRRDIKTKLRITQPVGMSTSFRKEIGLNINSRVTAKSTEKSALCKDVEAFFLRDDVTKLCPDTKKTIKNPITGESTQLRYRSAFVETLYHQFTAEVNSKCSLSSFHRYVPFNVKKPNPNEWGTCLCVACLNPELKYECLVRLKLEESITSSIETQIDGEKYDSFINILKELKKQKHADVTYSEWRKLNEEKTKCGKVSSSKVTRKVAVCEPFGVFIGKLIDEVSKLKQHLNRVHSQFKAFKEGRILASDDTGKNALLHIDWSENVRLRQVMEARDAYYFEDHLSIMAMHSWNGDVCQSTASLSDDTTHSAAGVWASLLPRLNSLMEDGVTYIMIVSDSPVTQFRNKTMFYYIQKYAEETSIMLKWIYLESGHGKGIPDGVGATVKRAISNVIPANADNPMYTVKDLLDNGLQQRLPSIEILVHETATIERNLLSLPPLFAVDATFKIHEVYTQQEGKDVQLFQKLTSCQPDSTMFSVINKKKKAKKISKPTPEEKEEMSDSDTSVTENEAVQSANDIVEIAESSSTKINVINKKKKAKKISKQTPKEKEKASNDDTLSQKEVAESPNDIAEVVESSAEKYSSVDFSMLKEDEWVLAFYEYDDMYFLGKILQISTEFSKAKVMCFKSSYGNSGIQEFESEGTAVWYDSSFLFVPPVIPELKKENRTHKYFY